MLVRPEHSSKRVRKIPADLIDALAYEGGHLVWRAGNKKGRAATSTYEDDGRGKVWWHGKGYAAARVVWRFVTGTDPVGEIDHINGDPSDNRIANLRDIPHWMNMENQRRAQAHGKAKLLGVSSDQGCFRARISVNGKRQHIGTFKTAEEAHRAYLDAKRRLHVGCTL